MSRAKAVFTPPAELVVVARSSYPIEQNRAACGLPDFAFSQKRVVMENISCSACFLRKQLTYVQTEAFLLRRNRI